jgi:hypothetical protein
MVELNKDVIYLILKELKNDSQSIYSCLLVNRTWCKATVPILWSDPVNQFRIYPSVNVYNILLNVILLHLSEETRNNLKNQGIELFMETYQKPLFNYISFWKNLNLFFLENMLTFVLDTDKKTSISIIRNEILKLFNMNTKFQSLVQSQCSHISGNESCFSELEYLYCDSGISSDTLERLAEINTSIRKLSFNYCYNSSYNIGIDGHNYNLGIKRLIETQKNLREINFFSYSHTSNESYYKSLEESLIKCADTVQYLKISWNPSTKFLSHLVNLLSLEIINVYHYNDLKDWSNLEKITLPTLKFLKIEKVPAKFLAGLIKNTGENLIEICILYQGIDYGGNLFQAICQKCPKLNYLKLSLYESDISNFESVLINCQFLIGLVVMEDMKEKLPYLPYFNKFDWNKLLKILVRSSPNSLFKFKFSSTEMSDIVEGLPLFLNNWKDRHPILLQTYSKKFNPYINQKFEETIQLYKVKGIIKKYEIYEDFEDFEWIYKKVENYFNR